jgi:hypothetical protein
MPRLRLAQPLWLDQAPRAPILPALDRTIHVDVAIVGGGITGVSAGLPSVAQPALPASAPSKPGETGRSIRIAHVSDSPAPRGAKAPASLNIHPWSGSNPARKASASPRAAAGSRPIAS